MFVHVERVGLLGKVVGPNGPSSLGSRVRLLTNVFSRAWLVTGRASRQERDGAYSSSVLAFAPAPAPGADPLPSPSPNRSAEPTPARNPPLSSGTSSACRRRSPASPCATASTRATPRACGEWHEHQYEREYHSRNTHGRDLSSSLSPSSSETWTDVGSSVSGDFSRTRGCGRLRLLIMATTTEGYVSGIIKALYVVVRGYSIRNIGKTNKKT